MIIYHQRNVATFKGGHTFYWPLQPIIQQRISATSAAAANTMIQQARGLHRFVFPRVFGRVN